MSEHQSNNKLGIREGTVRDLFVANYVLSEEEDILLDVSGVGTEDLLLHIWDTLGPQEYMQNTLRFMASMPVEELPKEFNTEEWEKFLEQEGGCSEDNQRPF